MNLTIHHFTKDQLNFIASELALINGKEWDHKHPVFVFNRCWLRLQKFTFNSLLHNFPTDNTREAPELVYFDHLISNGVDPLLATQECWCEYGMVDFHRALRSFWAAQDNGNRGWTYKRYIYLMHEYRLSIESGEFSIPIIILAREDNADKHQIKWLHQNFNIETIIRI